jgi:ankyrin repeat protein
VAGKLTSEQLKELLGVKNVPNNNDPTPLDWAAFKGNMEFLKAAIDAFNGEKNKTQQKEILAAVIQACQTYGQSLTEFLKFYSKGEQDKLLKLQPSNSHEHNFLQKAIDSIKQTQVK